MQIEQLKGGNYYHIYNRGNNRMNLFSEAADYEHFLWLYDKYISPVAETFAWVLMPNHLHLLVKLKQNLVYKYSKEHPVNANADWSSTLSGSGFTGDAAGWEKWFEEHKWETTDLSAPDLSAFGEPARLCHSRQTGIVGLAGGPDNVGMDNNAEMKADNVKIGLNADRSVTLSGLYKKPVPYRHFSHLFNAYTRYYHNRTGGFGNLFERPFKRKQINNEHYLKQVILYIHNNPIHHGFCNHPLEYPWSSYLSCVSEKPTKLNREAVTNLFENIGVFKRDHTKEFNINPIEKWLDIGFDLSAFAEPARLCHSRQTGIVGLAGGPDNVKTDVLPPACTTPDNVELILNADRSVTLPGLRNDDSDLSACAAPDKVMTRSTKRKMDSRK